MQNTDHQQFSYDSFKASFDSDPKIQNLIKDFDHYSITLKTDIDDEETQDQTPSRNKISQMANRAVDL